MYRLSDDPFVQNHATLLDARQVYLAGPFFTPEQALQNQALADALGEARFTYFRPEIECRYRKGDPPLIAQRAFALNRFHISNCNFVLADLCWPDTGTAWELGFAAASGRPILGIIASHQMGLNLMLRQTVDALIPIDQLAGHLGAFALDYERGRTFKALIERVGFTLWAGEQE